MVPAIIERAKPFYKAIRFHRKESDPITVRSDSWDGHGYSTIQLSRSKCFLKAFFPEFLKISKADFDRYDKWAETVILARDESDHSARTKVLRRIAVGLELFQLVTSELWPRCGIACRDISAHLGSQLQDRIGEPASRLWPSGITRPYFTPFSSLAGRRRGACDVASGLVDLN